MKAAGYKVRLDYLWIPDLAVTRARVKQRVKKGGHDIPDNVQLRRFGKGLRLLCEHYRTLIQEWRLYDNTGRNPQLVVVETDGRLRVHDVSKLAMIEAAHRLRIMSD